MDSILSDSKASALSLTGSSQFSICLPPGVSKVSVKSQTVSVPNFAGQIMCCYDSTLPLWGEMGQK